jgi:hypothetical protein
MSSGVGWNSDFFLLVPGDVGVVVMVDADMWICCSPIFVIVLAKKFVFNFVIVLIKKFIFNFVIHRLSERISQAEGEWTYGRGAAVRFPRGVNV